MRCMIYENSGCSRFGTVLHQITDEYLLVQCGNRLFLRQSEAVFFDNQGGFATPLDQQQAWIMDDLLELLSQ